ncbi:MAG: hypothetical protein H6716_19910 [Polyangiaceae bacterium]|nr:hypothetical protein [Polyangiaceae bacterium]
MLFGAFLPCTQQEVDDDLVAASPYVATVNGRVVWLDLSGADAVERLRSLDGPVAVRLAGLDPQQLALVDRLAERYPVEVEFRGSAVDLRPLEALTHVRGLRIVAPDAQWMPDLRRSLHLIRVAARIEDGDRLLARLPPTLQELHLQATLSSTGVAALAEFVQLKRLELGWAEGDLRLSDLESLQQLEELWLWQGVADDEFASIVQFPRLRELALDSDNLSGKALVHLTRLPELTELALYARNLSDTDMQHVSQLTSLTSLTIQAPLTNAGLSALQPLRKLKELVAQDTRLDDAAIPMLADFPVLKHLNLNDSDVSDEAAADLAKLTQLESLSLQRTRITGRTLKQLAPLTHLRELNLSLTSVRDTDLEYLAPFKDLRTLVFDRYTKVAIRHAAELPKLQALVAWYGTDDAEPFEPLRALPRFIFLSSLIRKLPCAKLRQTLGLLQCLDVKSL